MSAFQLKLIAVIAMIIDHVGMFFFPNLLLLRMIGRISFPIFCWLVANGAIKTHNINLYLFRLLLFACISQPFFYLAHVGLNQDFYSLNVLFTLFLGLAAIKFVGVFKNLYLRICGVVFIAVVSYLLHMDYGGVGVMSIVFFYLFYHKGIYMIASQIFVSAFFVLLFPPFWQSTHPQIYVFEYFIQLFSLCGLIFIGFYNGRLGLRMQYAFYLIYPMHYLVIIILQKTLV